MVIVANYYVPRSILINPNFKCRKFGLSPALIFLNIEGCINELKNATNKFSIFVEKLPAVSHEHFPIFSVLQFFLDIYFRFNLIYLIFLINKLFEFALKNDYFSKFELRHLSAGLPGPQVRLNFRNNISYQRLP